MKDRIRSVFTSTALAAAAIFMTLMPTAMQALPHPISTCQTITTDSSLNADIVTTGSSGPPCIVIGASNISLFLNGHTIDVRSEGMLATGIAAFDRTNVLIKGPGKVLTYYDYVLTITAVPVAILVVGGTDVEVHDVTVLNQEPGGSTCPDVPFGIGIEFQASGGNLHGNTVMCYQAGIDVSQSNPLSGGNIGFNTVQGNRTQPAGSGIIFFGSFGIGLRGSSNWNINNNTVQNSGLIAASGPNPGNPGTFLSGGIIVEGLGIAAGPTLPGGGSSNNTVVHNTVTDNRLFGIGIGGASSGNVVVNNTSKGNATDMVDLTTTGPNTWVNDRCVTELGAVPAGLCH